MKRFGILFFIGSIALGILVFGLWNDGNAGAADKTELEGKWVGIPQIGDWTFIFSGNSASVSSPNPNICYKGTFDLKASDDPKRIDLLIKESPLSQYIGKTSLGIYKLEKDTLTLSLNEPGNTTRPKSFTSTGGTQLFILTKQ